MLGATSRENPSFYSLFSHPRLHVAAAFHGLEHGDLVGVFDVAADGDSHGDAGDFHSGALELLRQVGSGGFAFDGGIGSDNDFVDVAGVDAGNQVGDAELLGSDAVERRNGTVENMEDSVEVLRLFDSGDIGRFFDDADQALVASGAGAVDARVDVGDVVADRTETEIGLDVADGGGERFGIVVAGAENVEGETLRTFGADSGELFQLIDQARHGFGKAIHGELSNWKSGNFVIENR